MTDVERAKGIVFQLELLKAGERVRPSRVLLSAQDCRHARDALEKVAPREVALSGVQTLSIGDYLRLKTRIDLIEEWVKLNGR
jgi:hypothetical protein